MKGAERQKKRLTKIYEDFEKVLDEIDTILNAVDHPNKKWAVHEWDPRSDYVFVVLEDYHCREYEYYSMNIPYYAFVDPLKWKAELDEIKRKKDEEARLKKAQEEAERARKKEEADYRAYLELKKKFEV